MIHITVYYQCVYKPRLISRATGSTSRVEPARGDEAIVYDVVDERMGTTLEMKENEAYGHGVNKNVGGQKLNI